MHIIFPHLGNQWHKIFICFPHDFISKWSSLRSSPLPLILRHGLFRCSLLLLGTRGLLSKHAYGPNGGGTLYPPGKKGRALEGPIAMFTYKHQNLGFEHASVTAPSPISPGRHSPTPPSPPPALSSRSRPLRLPYSQRPGRARAVAARASARGGNHGSRQEQEDLQGKEGWEEEDVSLLACSSDLSPVNCFVSFASADGVSVFFLSVQRRPLLQEGLV